jgi:hypothetical protein
MRRHWNCLLLALTATALGCVDPARAQAPADGSAAQTAPAGNPDARYAEILAQILRVHLDRLRQINSQVPGTVTDDDIAVLELQAKSFDKIAANAKDGKEAEWFSMVLMWAQISKISADRDWQRVAKLRQQGAISQADAEVVRLRAELAAVNLERGKAVQNKSADDRQNWALQFLVVEVQVLQDKVQRLEERE